MYFVRQGFPKLSSDRQTDTTENYYHSRFVGGNYTLLLTAATVNAALPH